MNLRGEVKASNRPPLAGALGSARSFLATCRCSGTRPLPRQCGFPSLGSLKGLGSARIEHHFTFLFRVHAGRTQAKPTSPMLAPLAASTAAARTAEGLVISQTKRRRAEARRLQERHLAKSRDAPLRLRRLAPRHPRAATQAHASPARFDDPKRRHHLLSDLPKLLEHSNTPKLVQTHEHKRS